MAEQIRVIEYQAGERYDDLIANASTLEVARDPGLKSALEEQVHCKLQCGTADKLQWHRAHMPLPKRPVLLGGHWKLNTILIALLTALIIAALTANSGRQIIEPSTVATVFEPEQFNRSYA
ncbi:hypothetical protein OEZ81_26530, partial [Leclercia adecarboxylata]|nr:hypothetical protein [Leclercia adecarboxylata]